MTYEIQKGIPVPPRGLTDTIRKMACGDSIIIPIDRRVAAHTSARSIGAKVKTKANHDGTLTVWRIDNQNSPGSRSDGADAGENIFGEPVHITHAPPPASSTPPPPRGGPPPEWPKIAKTRANPELGLPEGYYIRRDPYSAELWIQGPPPEGPYSPLKETVLDRYTNRDAKHKPIDNPKPIQGVPDRDPQIVAVAKAKQLEDMLK